MDAAEELAEKLLKEAAVEHWTPRWDELKRQVLLPLYRANRAELLAELLEARASEDGQVFGHPPRVEPVRSDADLAQAKAATRATMRARVREQVSRERRLVGEVEPTIGKLIADGPALADALARRGAAAVQPYLQLARDADGHDAGTGLPLHSIYRYLRYWWAFPYKPNSGRSLPFLIRDRGQPHHPVCGLLCLSSPVMGLTDRDDALGLTPGWLEAVTAMLCAVSEVDPLRELTALYELLRRQGRPALSPARIERDVSRLLMLDAPLSRWAARTSIEGRVCKAIEAATRIMKDLVEEIDSAIRGVSVEGLGVTLEQALADPGHAGNELRLLGKAAREEWAKAREQRTRAPKDVPRDDAADSARLFRKKRALGLARRLKGFEASLPVRDAADRSDALSALRAAVLRDRLTGGTAVPRGLSSAVGERRVRFMAAQVANVSVCGAIPPYNGLLGGKLAAMLAMSREAAHAYHQTYASRVSGMQSQTAGGDVVRPAELVALTTTSFYGVGSSQYNRVSLPQNRGLRWEEVGRTRGHGTLHLSEALCRLLGELLFVVHGRRLITAKHGEGSDQRRRKLAEGMAVLELPAKALLQHGFSRLVYVAPLGGHTVPGAPATPARHHLEGPTVDEISAAWRDRWLTPRLSRAIDAARAFNANDVLLSKRFPAELAEGRDGASVVVSDALTEEDATWV